MRLFYFVLGSGLGAVTRYLIESQMRRLYSFPTGILIVNTAGSFLLGVVAEESTTTSFAIIGFCGALTTWSALALDLDQERREGRIREFFLNIALNVTFGVAAVLLGLWVSG